MIRLPRLLRLAVPPALLVAGACGGGRAGDPAAFARSAGLDWKRSAAEEASPRSDWPALSGSPKVVTTQYAVSALHPTSGFSLTDARGRPAANAGTTRARDDGTAGGGAAEPPFDAYPWLAATDGSFETPLTLTGGPVTFRLRVKAIRQIGDWPQVRFLLDGREIGRQPLEGNAPDAAAAENFLSPRYRWIEAVASTEAAAGRAVLRVEYACTQLDPVERMGIRGILFDRLLVEQAPAATGCPAPAALPAGRKVLLVGLDGASWRVLLPLVNHGRMPNLARLLERGSYGPLDSEPMTYSPAIWSTIYTGQSRLAHGIDQMSQKSAEAREPAPHATSELKAATVFQMASAAGRSVLAVGLNTSWPAQRVRGVTVSDRFLDGSVPAGVWPPAQEGPARKALEALAGGRVVPGDLPAGLQASAARDARAVDLVAGYLSTGQPDLTAVYISLPDHAGHLLWKEHAPFGIEHRYPGAGSGPAGAAAPGASDMPLDPLERAMVFADGLLGRLVSAVDAATAIVIVSDHSTDVADPATSTRYRLAPLLRAIAGDRAYSPYVENWLVAHVFLNVRGREAGGTVPAEEAESEARRLAETLAGLRTASGSKVFEAVQAHPPRAGGGTSAPADIVGILNGGLDPADAIVLPSGERLGLSEIIHPLDDRSGTHDRFGVIAAAGGGIRRGGLIASASIFDVAPTLLSLLGLPQAADMPGRPLAEALAGEAAPPCWIRSWLPLAAATPAPATGAAPMTQQERDRLRGLGYVQ